jgi:phosphoribosylcarboxyaminoimidazole (NCAIR) mutase
VGVRRQANAAAIAFDGNIFNTTVVSATRLEASVPGAALGATPRQVSVLVTRIGGAAQSSNALPFQILPAQDGG